jgi:hypothetical protein
VADRFVIPSEDYIKRSITKIIIIRDFVTHD